MSLQSDKQASFRAISGTSGTYNEDARACFEAETTIPANATFDEAFILWLQERTGLSTGNLPDLMNAFAKQEGANNWSSLGAFGPNFTPADLFASGEAGAWYEIHPNYLYQDAAGTTPVTADGDPVGYVEDRSGNGNHATQSTTASKPTYRTDGTYHWLEFDGTGDTLYVDLASFAYPYFLIQSCEVNSASPSDPSAMFGIFNTGSSSPSYALYGRRGLTSTDQVGLLVISGGAGNSLIDTTGAKRVIGAELYAGSQKVILNAEDGNALNKTEVTSAIRLAIGSAQDSTPSYFPGLFYGGLVVSREVAGSEKDGIFPYMANLNGASI